MNDGRRMDILVRQQEAPGVTDKNVHPTGDGQE